MAGRSVTINEAMIVMKQLKDRQSELLSLRNQNSVETTRYIGANAEKNEVKKPVYDVKKLDSLANVIGREIRILDLAIKNTNQATAVVGYTFDEEKLFGSLE
jgi:hypothetical protein